MTWTRYDGCVLVEDTPAANFFLSLGSGKQGQQQCQIDSELLELGPGVTLVAGGLASPAVLASSPVSATPRAEAAEGPSTLS